MKPPSRASLPLPAGARPLEDGDVTEPVRAEIEAWVATVRKLGLPHSNGRFGGLDFELRLASGEPPELFVVGAAKARPARKKT